MTEPQDFVDCGVGDTDRLERLWAPYRMNYIIQKGAHPQESSQPYGAAQQQQTGDAHAGNGGNLTAQQTQARQACAPATEKQPLQVSQPHVRPNPFVEIPNLSDEEGLIVARGHLVYCVLNLYSYNSGHMMVVPYRQEPDLENLSFAESTELMAFAQAAVRVLKKVSRPDACNVGFNLGRAAGGSVGEHLHLHIVPRWNGDSNFMTVLDGTKVLPQLLRDTRQLLAGAWAELALLESEFPGVAHA